jgi:Rrf2 family transcriptional regulator, cysteine metabolism repressor
MKSMKISTKGRYGTRALLDLATHHDNGPVALKDIAKRQQFSLPYLEHLVAPLIAGGLVRSVKGPKGGITLAKSPAKIKLSEIIRLLEGSTAPVECVDNPDICSRSKFCVTRDVWEEVKKATNGILDATTLQALVERQSKKITKDEMYYI